MSSWRPQGGPAARPLSRRLAFRPRLLNLEERAVPSGTTAGTTTDPSASGSTTSTTDATSPIAYAVGADVGNPPLVQVHNQDGSLRYSFMAYNVAFRGGVRVAVGDVTGDGVPDIVTAPGSGLSSQIKVYDGTSGAEIANYMAYRESFRGGVYVAVADINGDGHSDIITGAGAGGGPHVKVMDGKWVVPPIGGAPASTTPTGLPGSADGPGILTQFYAYNPAFTGGVRVAAADINGDGKADIVTGAGQGGGPHVKAIDGATGQLMYQFYAFDATYSGGVFVTAGDALGDHKAELIVGSGVGLEQVNEYDHTGTQIRSYAIDDPAAAIGVHVAMTDIDGDGKADLLLSVGTNVEVRDPLTNATKDATTPFDPSVLGGVFVG